MYLCSGSKYEDQNSLEQWCSITNHHSSLRDSLIKSRSHYNDGSRN